MGATSRPETKNPSHLPGVPDSSLLAEREGLLGSASLPSWLEPDECSSTALSSVRKYKTRHPLTGRRVLYLAEREGFEPSILFRVCTLSKGVPSATRPSLRMRTDQKQFLELLRPVISLDQYSGAEPIFKKMARRRGVEPPTSRFVV